MTLFIAMAAALSVGYILFIVFSKLLTNRFDHTNSEYSAEVVEEARKQAEHIKYEAVQTEIAKLQLNEEDVESELRIRKEDLKLEEEALTLREDSLVHAENRIKKQEKDFNEVQAKLHVVQKKKQDIEEVQSQFQSEISDALAKRSNVDIKQTLEQQKLTLIQSRTVEQQKLIRLQVEELQNSVKRVATRFMGRAMTRYAPEFYWPKMINHVDVPEDKKNLIEILTTENCPLFQIIKEKAEVDAVLVQPDRTPSIPHIKLNGGMGAYREAMRLALMEFIQGGSLNFEKLTPLFEKYKQNITLQAQKLGKIGVDELQLKDIHPEVQLLIGFLNWRTSYRQNQFLHSLEVAKLAGLVAHEVGVDAMEAKRCGLLHDIGKVLDYRIEGSHAVISGDYADRYGERRDICDVLMSHHNDLVVESPMAYVLKTADTLSGARPGARVNLEEGYQLRLGAIDEVVKSFNGVTKVIIMNGAKEVHVEVNHRRVRDEHLQELASAIAKKITEDVAFPGQIKVMVTRRLESTAVA